MASPSKSRPVFFALLILWTTPGLAQEEEPIEIRMERLEARLAEARGRDRFELLVELTELAWKERSYIEVLSFGEEARAHLPSVGDPKRELILTSALMAAYTNQRTSTISRGRSSPGRKPPWSIAGAGSSIPRSGSSSKQSKWHVSSASFWTSD